MPKFSDQKGIIDPKIVVGGIIAAVVIFFLATGNFKFSASVKDNSTQEATQEITQEEQSTPQPTAKPKTYQSEKYEISLEYPASWSLKENPAPTYIAGFFTPKEGNDDNYIESLGVKAIDISSQPNITLQEITDLFENQTKKSEDTFVVIDRQSSTIAGEDTKDLIYTFKDKDNNGKGIARITLKNKTAYIFQYNALESDYDKYLPTVETILASVKF